MGTFRRAEAERPQSEYEFKISRRKPQDRPKAPQETPKAPKTPQAYNSECKRGRTAAEWVPIQDNYMFNMFYDKKTEQTAAEGVRKSYNNNPPDSPGTHLLIGKVRIQRHKKKKKQTAA